ncbi:MAG TPA: cache domain-containing protein [Gammaproteobacteria bacterium]|nr:cache domain-containing protein [Gammaproteobacteria bacterium]
MLEYLIRQSKKIVVTLKFSILAIFVTLFVLSMLTLIAITHIRFTRSMEDFSFGLMKQASYTAFTQIQNELKNAEIESHALAELIKLDVLDSTSEVETYIQSLMRNEIDLFPSVQSIVWADTAGHYVSVEKTDDGKLHSEIVQYNPDNPSYDPRLRPWYIIAKNEKKPVWMGIYAYEMTKYRGTSVATPVYKNDNTLLGVVNLRVRLDNMRDLVEQTQVSAHSITFIVSSDGQLIAFPNLVQYNQSALLNIKNLEKSPWIAESFDIYNKTHSAEFIYEYNKKDYLASYLPLTSFGSNNHWIIGVVSPTEDFMSDVYKTHLLTLLINLTILIFGITAVSILISRVVHPLNEITKEIRRIRDFVLTDEKPIVSRILEISYIAEALYSMKKGLKTFQRYVPSALVRQLIETGEDARIGGIKKPLAILFSDIKDFTSLAEKMDPEKLSPHLCDYFDELSQVIVMNHGTIDKYMGDAIMAFWGAPSIIEQPSLYAAKAALRCLNLSEELNETWQEQGKPLLHTRIGIHFGQAIVGNFGSSERISYTAIGDAINIASRLEGINKIYGTQIIVSDVVYHQIKNDFVLRMLDCITVKGRNEAHYIYELVAETYMEITYDFEKYTMNFAKGFAAYQKRQWDEAISFFVECLKIYPADTVAGVLIKRCEHFKSEPPEADWSGIWKLE